MINISIIYECYWLKTDEICTFPKKFYLLTLINYISYHKLTMKNTVFLQHLLILANNIINLANNLIFVVKNW